MDERKECGDHRKDETVSTALRPATSSPGPESGPRSKGLSAEIVAKKIGKSKNDVKAIRAIQKPDKAVPEVAKLVRDGKLNHRRAYDFVQGVPKDKQADGIVIHLPDKGL